MASTAPKLRIQLSPSQIEPVRKWIQKFKSQEKNWTEYPMIRKAVLYITVPCFPFFMGYASESDSNEFDIKGLRARGKNLIKRALSSGPSYVEARFYQKSLENLNLIEIGEFSL